MLRKFKFQPEDFASSNEVLESFNTIADSSNYNMSIRVCQNYKQRNYFLIYNHEMHIYATKVARISFIEPKYIFEDCVVPNWTLSNKEKDYLIDMVNGYDHICEFDEGEYTNWQVMLMEYYFTNKLRTDLYVNINSFRIPNYLKL